jgi:hypothetical protein
VTRTLIVLAALAGVGVLLWSMLGPLFTSGVPSRLGATPSVLAR